MGGLNFLLRYLQTIGIVKITTLFSYGVMVNWLASHSSENILLTNNFLTWGNFMFSKNLKRQGVGRLAFELSIKRYTGQWITRVLVENTAALAFWKTVIAEVTNNNFELEKNLYGAKEMYFFKYSVVLKPNDDAVK